MLTRKTDEIKYSPELVTPKPTKLQLLNCIDIIIDVGINLPVLSPKTYYDGFGRRKRQLHHSSMSLGQGYDHSYKH